MLRGSLLEVTGGKRWNWNLEPGSGPPGPVCSGTICYTASEHGSIVPTLLLLASHAGSFGLRSTAVRRTLQAPSLGSP